MSGTSNFYTCLSSRKILDTQEFFGSGEAVHFSEHLAARTLMHGRTTSRKGSAIWVRGTRSEIAPADPMRFPKNIVCKIFWKEEAHRSKVAVCVVVAQTVSSAGCADEATRHSKKKFAKKGALCLQAKREVVCGRWLRPCSPSCRSARAALRTI